MIKFKRNISQIHWHIQTFEIYFDTFAQRPLTNEQTEKKKYFKIENVLRYFFFL